MKLYHVTDGKPQEEELEAVKNPGKNIALFSVEAHAREIQALVKKNIPGSQIMALEVGEATEQVFHPVKGKLWIPTPGTEITFLEVLA